MSTPFLNFSRIICTNFRQDHASGFWGAGLCGWNCCHTFFALFPELGDPPAWTRDQLEELNARNIEYNGKLYTRYEINQMQRARERNVRRWKKRYLAETAAGVDTTDSAVRLKAARQSLAEFANATGGRVDSARVSVPKFGRSEGSKAAWAPTSPPAAGRKAAQHDNSPAVPVIPVPRGCFCIYWSIRMRSSCTTSCSARQIRSTSEISITPAACMRLISCCALASAAQICVRFSSGMFMIITILF